jgi:hypothetical protein
MFKRIDNDSHCCTTMAVVYWVSYIPEYRDRQTDMNVAIRCYSVTPESHEHNTVPPSKKTHRISIAFQ